QHLTETAQPQQKGQTQSLRDTGEREKLIEDLSQQRQRLSGLQEQMRQTIEEAEPTEPLLAERLYDATRNLQDQNVERALESAERSLRNGLSRDAHQHEQSPGPAISQPRDGIQRAAGGCRRDQTATLPPRREK